MRDFYSDFNLFAVSANAKETALNTPQTLDTTLPVDKGNVINIMPRREDNRDMLTGKEEPDELYAKGQTSEGPMEVSKAMAQHLAIGYGFALGNVSSVAAGTGKKHTITKAATGPLPLTAGQRLGANAAKRRFASIFIDSLTASFERDGFAKLSLGLKGTGMVDENVTEETVSALNDTTTITVATAVHDDDVDSIHGIFATEDTGEEVDVTVVSVDGTDITIVALGGDGLSNLDYRVVYVPTEPAWCTFPSRIIEPPLKVANMVAKLNAKWDGSVITGGHDIATELKSIEHTLTRGIEPIFSPGGTGDYADLVQWAALEQKLAINREFRDYLVQQHLKNNDYLVIQVKLVGPEYEAGYAYEFELIFPKVGILAAPISVDGRIVAEAGDLQVLEDSTYGSVQATVQNKVAAYAA